MPVAGPRRGARADADGRAAVAAGRAARHVPARARPAARRTRAGDRPPDRSGRGRVRRAGRGRCPALPALLDLVPRPPLAAAGRRRPGRGRDRAPAPLPGCCPRSTAAGSPAATPRVVDAGPRAGRRAGRRRRRPARPSGRRGRGRRAGRAGRTPAQHRRRGRPGRRAGPAAAPWWRGCTPRWPTAPTGRRWPRCRCRWPTAGPSPAPAAPAAGRGSAGHRGGARAADRASGRRPPAAGAARRDAGDRPRRARRRPGAGRRARVLRRRGPGADRQRGAGPGPRRRDRRRARSRSWPSWPCRPPTASGGRPASCSCPAPRWPRWWPPTPRSRPVGAARGPTTAADVLAAVGVLSTFAVIEAEDVSLDPDDPGAGRDRPRRRSSVGRGRCASCPPGRCRRGWTGWSPCATSSWSPRTPGRRRWS